jgi:uncharacterized protein
MEISADQLSPSALQGIVEEFITREGTDYGLVESSLEEKIAEVMAQISNGAVVICFETESQTCTLLLKE